MDTYQPYVVAFAQNKGEEVVFTRLDALVRVPNPDNLTWEFAAKCNGQRTVREISTLFPAEKSSLVEQIFVTLKQEKLVYDSRMLYQAFHDWSAMPMVTTFGLSDQEIVALVSEPVTLPKSVEEAIPLADTSVDQTTAGRKTSRSFTGEAISHSELSTLLYAMYKKQESVPSAGAFYSSVVYCAVLRDSTDLKSGLYVYDHYAHTLLLVRRVMPMEKIAAVLGSSMVENASVVFFITSQVGRIAKKYGSRAYRYALLEAGHIAQNAYVSTIRTRIGVCEYGGFFDEHVENLLDTETEGNMPLIVMIAGVESELETKGDGYEKLFKRLEPWAKEKGLIDSVSYAFRSVDGYTMSVCVAETMKKIGKTRNFSLGSGLTAYEAMSKAVAEAYERYVSGQVRIDTKQGEESSDSMPTLDINLICPQKDAYLASIGLTSERQTHFVVGERYLGGRVKIPVDQVFYPVTEKEVGPMSYFANSTGIATHTEESIAVKKAVLELIERDAIGVHWYAQATPDQIDPATCSDWIRYRIDELVASGREAVFLRLTTDFTPVVMCMILGKTYPYCVIGSASEETHAKAVEKSLTEAEITLVSLLNSRRKKILPEKVRSVDDHATHSAQHKREDIAWMLSGKVIPLSEADVDVLGVEDALRKMNPVVVRLDDPSSSLMPVVKVVSEKLLPITFGYGAEHYGHPRLAGLGLEWKQYPALPHPLA